MYKNITRIEEFLLLSIPVVLITGPFLPDLALSMMCMIFLIKKIYNQEYNIYALDYFGKIFFLWCLYLILRSALSDDPFLSFESSLFFFRFGVFAYAVKSIIERNSNVLKKLFIVILIMITLVVSDGLIQFIFGQNLLGYSYDGYRLSLFDETKLIGHYLARIIPLLLAIGILYYYKSKTYVILIMLIFIASDVIIFLSGERTSFFILTSFTFLILMLISKWKFVRLLTIILSALIIFTLINTSSLVKQRMVTQTLNQFGAGITFSPEHDLLYESSFNMFLDNKVFGVGPKLFRTKCSDKKYAKDIFGHTKTIESWDENNSCNTHPHNIYLQLLAETGMLGIFPLVIFLLYLSYLLLKQATNILFWKKYAMNDYSVCLIISLFVQIWPIMPHLSIFNNWVNVYIFLTIGLLMTSKYFKKN